MVHSFGCFAPHVDVGPTGAIVALSGAPVPGKDLVEFVGLGDGELVFDVGLEWDGGARVDVVPGVVVLLNEFRLGDLSWRIDHLYILVLLLLVLHLSVRNSHKLPDVLADSQSLPDNLHQLLWGWRSPQLL